MPGLKLNHVSKRGHKCDEQWANIYRELGSIKTAIHELIVADIYTRITMDIYVWFLSRIMHYW